MLLVDVIGSIVISLSRCCLPNGEGQAPLQIFFPRTAHETGSCAVRLAWSRRALGSDEMRSDEIRSDKIRSVEIRSNEMRLLLR